MSLFRSSIVRRWIDILLLVACSLLFGVVFKVSLGKALQVWINYCTAWGPVVSYAVILFVVTLLTIVLIRLGALGVRFRIITMLRYPPSWFAAIIVIVIVGISVVQGEALDSLATAKNLSSVGGIVFVVLLLGIFLGFSCHRLEELRSSPLALRESGPEFIPQDRHIFENDEDLLLWIFEERPIQHPNQDIFEHAIPARRIANLLNGWKSSSIGLVGPYGSGKSGFVNLIEYYLKNPIPECTRGQNQKFNGKIILCRIDGWGRASGTVAQKILSLAIGEVKKYVDCTSVIALPDNYRKAIARTSSVGGTFFSVLFQSFQDPVAQLCRLDNILVAANLRLIIVLEDLDRNVGDEIIGEEMPALLDRLRVLNNVSFVLAIGTEQQFLHILIRICDHVEAIS